MSEDKIIETTAKPMTRARIVSALRDLGVRKGSVVLVHSALSRLGWVVGGAQGAVEALLEAIGAEGTLVVPAQSGGNSEPAHWRAPPVPESWWQEIRDTMPAFDPAVTPTRRMGAIPELVRIWPDARRSNHPQDSFAAVGPQADYILSPHNLHDAFGETSPLARLEALGADILLLGVPFDNCTAFHLSEHRSGRMSYVESGSAIKTNGERQWVAYMKPDYDADDFGRCGEAFCTSGLVRTGLVGEAQTKLFAFKDAVAFASMWLRENRPPPDGQAA